MKKQGAERALQAKYRDYVSEGSAAAISKSRQAGSKLNLGTTGCGAAGSALDWGSRGREFKSRHSDHIRTKVMIPLVLQLSFFFFLQKSLYHKPFRLSGIKEKFQRG